MLWLKSRGLLHARTDAPAGTSPRSVQPSLDDYHDGGLDRARRPGRASRRLHR